MTRKQINFLIFLIVLFLLGLGIRLIDLDDPPLDFNPTRQLRSAIIARGLFYRNNPEVDLQERDLAITHMNTMERLEPPVFETVVAWGYGLLGGENLAVARVLVSIIWLVGAVFLFDLGRRMTSPWSALVGFFLFLFLPFSVRASRSFQPDPGMVTLIILTAWALYRWQEKRTWKWVLFAGILGGLAILTKVVAVFFITGISLGVVLYSLGLGENARDDESSQWQLSNFKSELINSQIWVMVALMVSPALIYYLTGLNESNSGTFLHWTVINRWRDILTPSFYMRWMIFLDDLLGLFLILAALIGALSTTPRNRTMLLGFWGGYLVFGLFFPYHILTHDYYHLTLIALLALSVMPVADLIIRAVVKQSRGIQVLCAIILFAFIAYNGWIARSIIVGQDFREHPTFWQEVGDAIPIDAKGIGLSQDYGFRLMYYGWRKIDLWPNNARPEELAEKAGKADLFVVTAKNQMSDQLQKYLEDNYLVYAQGPGYIIYDLKEKP